MSLWIVRWPHLLASIVDARNEQELADILDQCGDPRYVRWEPFSGPLWVDFWVPETDRGTFPDEFLEVPNLKIDRGSSEDGIEMQNEVLRFAFPALWNLIENQGDEPLKPTDVRKAQKSDQRSFSPKGYMVSFFKPIGVWSQLAANSAEIIQEPVLDRSRYPDLRVSQWRKFLRGKLISPLDREIAKRLRPILSEARKRNHDNIPGTKLEDALTDAAITVAGGPWTRFPIYGRRDQWETVQPKYNNDPTKEKKFRTGLAFRAIVD